MGEVKPERGLSEIKEARCKSKGGGVIPKGANVVMNITLSNNVNPRVH